MTYANVIAGYYIKSYPSFCRTNVYICISRRSEPTVLQRDYWRVCNTLLLHGGEVGGMQWVETGYLYTMSKRMYVHDTLPRLHTHTDLKGLCAPTSCMYYCTDEAVIVPGLDSPRALCVRIVRTVHTGCSGKVAFCRPAVALDFADRKRHADNRISMVAVRDRAGRTVGVSRCSAFSIDTDANS